MVGEGGSDAGLVNMPDLKQRGQWEHSSSRNWMILLVINKRRIELGEPGTYCPWMNSRPVEQVGWGWGGGEEGGGYCRCVFLYLALLKYSCPLLIVSTPLLL